MSEVDPPDSTASAKGLAWRHPATINRFVI